LLHVRLIYGRGHSLDLVDSARRVVAGRTGGPYWRAVLAFVPRETGSGEYEPVVKVGRKVMVVGFRDEAAVEVVPAEWPGRRSVLNTKDRG
jgi:hypothetical protein